MKLLKSPNYRGYNYIRLTHNSTYISTSYIFKVIVGRVNFPTNDTATIQALLRLG